MKGGFKLWCLCAKFFLIYTLGQNGPKNHTRKILNYVESLCAEFFSYFLIYIVEQNVPKKNQTRKILNYIKSLCIIFCAKITRYSQTLLMHLKALLGKNWLYSFFLIFSLQKFHHLQRCHTISINSSVIIF